MMMLAVGAAVVGGLCLLGLCASVIVLKGCLEVDSEDEAER
jgi:hypothetical protein